MRGPFVVTPGLEESPVPCSRPPGTGRSDRLSSTLLPNPGIEESRRGGPCLELGKCFGFQTKREVVS